MAEITINRVVNNTREVEHGLRFDICDDCFTGTYNKIKALFPNANKPS